MTKNNKGHLGFRYAWPTFKTGNNYNYANEEFKYALYTTISMGQVYFKKLSQA